MHCTLAYSPFAFMWLHRKKEQKERIERQNREKEQRKNQKEKELEREEQKSLRKKTEQNGCLEQKEIE